jgi:DNA-binding transcriptional ArsR family regulator
MDAAIAAIAHPARRRLLALVRDGELSSSELADAVGLTRPATSQHLRVLRDAGLVAVRRQGGHRYYRVDGERLEALRAELENFWVGRVGALKRAAERRHREDTADGP